MDGLDCQEILTHSLDKEKLKFLQRSNIIKVAFQGLPLLGICYSPKYLHDLFSLLFQVFTQIPPYLWGHSLTPVWNYNPHPRTPLSFLALFNSTLSQSNIRVLPIYLCCCLSSHLNDSGELCFVLLTAVSPVLRISLACGKFSVNISWINEWTGQECRRDMNLKRLKSSRSINELLQESRWEEMRAWMNHDLNDTTF